MSSTLIQPEAHVRRPAGVGRSVWRAIRPALRTARPFFALLVVWQLVSWSGIVSGNFFPSPSQVLQTGGSLLMDGTLFTITGLTLQRLAKGAAIGLVVGIALAMLFTTFGRTWRVVRPVVNYLEAMGEIGWLPVFVLWVGFGEPAIVTTIAYTVAFPVLFGTLRGFAVVPPHLGASAATLGASRRQIFVDVLVPGAAPGIITGFRVGMGFAWRTVILAEMLVARDGLGVMLFGARSLARVDLIFVGMVAAGVLWTVTDQLLLKRLETATVERWGTQR